MIAFFLTHWFQYFYVPGHGPWYSGNVWGNVFVIAVIVPLGFAWSKTKFWPLRPVKHALEHLQSHARHQTQLVEEMHHLAHTGKEHPRVIARREAGQHPTASHDPAEQL